MGTFLLLATVCLVGGFLITALVWEIFWITGVFAPPLAVQKAILALRKPQYTTRLLDSPPCVASGSTTRLWQMNTPAKDLPIVRGTGTGSVLVKIVNRQKGLISDAAGA